MTPGRPVTEYRNSRRPAMIEAERLMTITYDEYACARNALDTLVRERAAVLPRGLDALRASTTVDTAQTGWLELAFHGEAVA